MRVVVTVLRFGSTVVAKYMVTTTSEYSYAADPRQSYITGQQVLRVKVDVRGSQQSSW